MASGGGSATLQTIIGLKRLDIAKRRLGDALNARERRALVLTMLDAVVAACRDAAVGAVALATSEPDAAEIGRRLDVGVLPDADLEWNAGLVHALTSTTPRPDRVLYLAGDLPLLTGAELRSFVDAAPAPGVAVARARDNGTNALLITPALAMTPSFGAARSSAVHADRARAAGLAAVVIDLPGLAHDIDTIDDLRAASVSGRGRALRPG